MIHHKKYKTLISSPRKSIIEPYEGYGNKRRKTILYIFSLAFLFSIFSCDVGLGEAVDTEPPSVEISTPLANDKIRGTFTMSGSCSDEQGVKSVEIQFSSIDDSTGIVSYYPTGIYS